MIRNGDSAVKNNKNCYPFRLFFIFTLMQPDNYGFQTFHQGRNCQFFACKILLGWTLSWYGSSNWNPVWPKMSNGAKFCVNHFSVSDFSKASGLNFPIKVSMYILPFWGKRVGFAEPILVCWFVRNSSNSVPRKVIAASKCPESDKID